MDGELTDDMKKLLIAAYQKFPAGEPFNIDDLDIGIERQARIDAAYNLGHESHRYFSGVSSADVAYTRPTKGLPLYTVSKIGRNIARQLIVDMAKAKKAKIFAILKYVWGILVSIALIVLGAWVKKAFDRLDTVAPASFPAVVAPASQPSVP